MKRKGFTLVELLAVIAILAVIISIALISVTKIRENALIEIVETKKDQIEQAAILYGQDNPNELTTDDTDCSGKEITTTNNEGRDTN